MTKFGFGEVFLNPDRKSNLEALLVHPEATSSEQECEASIVFNKLKPNISIYNYIITRKLDTVTPDIHLNPLLIMSNWVSFFKISEDIVLQSWEYVLTYRGYSCMSNNGKTIRIHKIRCNRKITKIHTEQIKKTSKYAHANVR